MSYPSRAELAAEVRAEMARQRVTPSQLAEATGISRATLGRRLSGQLAFTVDELALISTHLQVAPSRFIAAAVVADNNEEVTRT